MSHLLLLAKLALRDLWHDRKLSFCMAASLMAVIGPLLLLFGLKHGVISQMQDALARDPVNLEIRMTGNGNFSQEWLNILQQRSDVGFAAGQIRSLSAYADIVKDRQHYLQDAEIIPTANGDPLAPALPHPLTETEVLLSSKAAARLDASAGDVLRLRATRKRNDVRERAELAVTVAGVIDVAYSKRDAVYVSAAVQFALERFFDGEQVEQMGIHTGEPPSSNPIVFARARIYARDMDSVESLERWLNEQHIQTSSRLNEISNVKAINNVLELIFGVIAGTALAGCMASLIGAFVANIDRKRKDLAVLRLLGFRNISIALYVLLQAWVLTTLAYAAGLAAYGAASMLFDQALGAAYATDGFSCHITLYHMAVALLAVWTVALIVSCIGALRAVSIQPAESLREL